MQVYKIKRIIEQLYLVKVSSWILATQLFTMKEFTVLSEEDHIFAFKTTEREEKLENAGERKFLKLLQGKGLDLEMYSQMQEIL